MPRPVHSTEDARGAGAAGIAGVLPSAPPECAAGDGPTRDGDLSLPRQPLLLVTGIARPERVRHAADAAGVVVADHLVFPDHHAYPPRSLRRIAGAAARAGAAGVLTTGKDRVKLAGKLPLPLWELPLTAAPAPAFWSWLATCTTGSGSSQLALDDVGGVALPAPRLPTV